MQFSYPLLVCDIGGTYTRIAFVRHAGAALEREADFKTTDFPDLATAALAAAQGGPRIASMIACAAGPVCGRTLQMTNAAWTLDGIDLRDRLGLDQGLLLNDFEAQALATPNLPSGWKRSIGSPAPTPDSWDCVRVVLGPGTGLGAASVVTAQGRHTPFPSEAGHVDFGPADADEERYWPHIERPYGRVSAETIVSGPGLFRLHKARLRALDKPISVIDPVDLVDRAAMDRLGDEAQTLRAFWRLVARFAGDLALTCLARGGVILSGGVLPRIAGFLDEQEFRRIFEAKAPMSELMRSIPTELVTAPQAVLVGMAAVAASPELYGLDYAARAWRPAG